MADVRVVVHTVLCPCSEEELTERISGIITEHAAGSREGIVPALLAEDLVARLRAAQSLIFLRELEGDE